MFGKKRKIKNRKNAEYKIESENLAVPEIHTGEVEDENASEEQCSKESITYDNVAIPEIHIRRK